MAKANYSKRERQWGIYHRLEQKRKARSLKKLSEAGAIKILTELYSFVYESGVKPRLNTLDIAKIRTLANVHSMFGRVKG